MTACELNGAGCRNHAVWRVRFVSTPSKTYYYCDWHGTRRKGKPVWHPGELIEMERI